MKKKTINIIKLNEVIKKIKSNYFSNFDTGYIIKYTGYSREFVLECIEFLINIDYIEYDKNIGNSKMYKLKEKT